MQLGQGIITACLFLVVSVAGCLDTQTDSDAQSQPAGAIEAAIEDVVALDERSCDFTNIPNTTCHRVNITFTNNAGYDLGIGRNHWTAVADNGGIASAHELSDAPTTLTPGFTVNATVSFRTDHYEGEAVVLQELRFSDGLTDWTSPVPDYKPVFWNDHYSR